ncbi:proline dehydrogenase family protein [Thermoflavimicrobium daqui]|jgi:proline dehydrogenase|uniref:proline dehydrogenase n=1 Tax=Thermoflavimicrobium daqui TaxID=2137476 RepID=A0A364K1R6_9BACL|nr:proline dehydrogenase family protein [Thermoflavimicrobium daqui]RAL21972.1 proline dehydrogenase [Thermoflavimicrobium daqui]
MKTQESQVSQALKSIARNQHIKSYIQQSNELYPLLLKAAKRFVTGENKQDGIEIAKELISKGYFISLEYIGENTAELEDCIKVKEEFLNLIEKMGSMSMKQTVSLDLSHIGLSLNPDIAYKHLLEIAEKANQYGITLMISMEESSKTDDILDIYKKATKQYPNVGITLQAHLYRSSDDIKELIYYPGRIRVVKGAYEESAEISIARSEELTERYLSLVDTLVAANHPVSIATHDEVIIQELLHRKHAQQPNVEFEMLYGIRSDLIWDLKEKGYQTKVYLTYGKEWYLYLCHRLAEYPPNIYTAISDIVQPDLTDKISY